MLGDHSNIDHRSEMSAGFLRQRRNLVLISLLLPLFVFGEAKLDKLNIFGTTIDIGDPSAIIGLIVLIFIYFFGRYWQYYGNERGAKDYRINMSRHIFQYEFKYFSDLMRGAASVFDYEHYYPQFSCATNGDYAYGYNRPEIAKDKRLGLLRRSRLMQINSVGKKYEQHYLGRETGCGELSEEEIARIAARWRFVPKAQGDSRSEPIFETDIEYSVIAVIIVRLKSYLLFLANKPEFTDYKFPIWLSVLAFCSSIAKLLFV